MGTNTKTMKGILMTRYAVFFLVMVMHTSVFYAGGEVPGAPLRRSDVVLEGIGKIVRQKNDRVESYATFLKNGDYLACSCFIDGTSFCVISRGRSCNTQSLTLERDHFSTLKSLYKEQQSKQQQ